MRGTGVLANLRERKNERNLDFLPRIGNFDKNSNEPSRDNNIDKEADDYVASSI